MCHSKVSCICPVACCSDNCWVCRNDVASATAGWHQVREELMQIVSKSERRAQLDKQVGWQCLTWMVLCTLCLIGT